MGPDPAMPTLKAGDRLAATVLSVAKGRDALLRFGSFKAYARLPLPVSTGQQVQLQVESEGANLRLVMAPPRGDDRASGAATGNKPLLVHPFEPVADRSLSPGILRTLVPGTIIEGRITGFEKEGRMLVDFGRFKTFARIDIPVRQGQTVPMVVVNADQGLTLQVATGRSTSLLPRTIPADPAVGGKANGASSARASFFPAAPTATEMDTLRQSLQSLIRAAASLRTGALMKPAMIAPRLTGPPGAPNAASTSGQPTSVQVTPGQPTSVQVTPGQPTSVQVASGQPTSGQVAPGQPTSVQVAPGQPASVQAIAEQTAPAYPTDGQSPRGQSVTVSSVLANIHQFLSPANPEGDRMQLIVKIADFVENSGVLFEKKLEHVLGQLQRQVPSTPPETLYQHPDVRQLIATDLKPNLLILDRFLHQLGRPEQANLPPGVDRHLIETLKDVVQRSLAHIDHQQTTAAEKPVEQSVYQAFSHLLHLTDSRQNARLKVYYAKKGKSGEDKKPPRVSLLLEMDRLGAVRSDLWMVGKDLNITFFVSDETARDHIQAGSDQICVALKKTFNTVAVNVVVSATKITEFDGEELMPTRSRQVDISA